MKTLPPSWPRHHEKFSPDCELCGREADYVDSVPDVTVKGYSPSEAGYRPQSLCWLCGAQRRQVSTSRLRQVIVVGEGASRVAYLDRDRASGDCLCEHCGRRYYDHPAFPEHPYLNQLCDGSAVKL